MIVHRSTIDFLQRLSRDREMQKRMHSALDDATDRKQAAVHFAEREGFTVTPESLRAARVAIERRARLDDEHFEEISSSRDPHRDTTDSNPTRHPLELDPTIANELLRW